MARFEETRNAFAGSFQNRRLWLIQFFANPVLFALFAAWLLIPVARTWQIILNAVLAAGIVVAALVLHAGTLNYFCDRSGDEGAALKLAFGRALRHLAAVAVWAGAFYLIWELVGKLDEYHDAVPTFIRSMFPAFLRQLISLGVITALFDGFVFVLRWIVAPGLLLPLALRAADVGFRGWGRAGLATWKAVIASLQYWGVVTLAAVLGVFASGRIMDWTPRSADPTFAGETISLILRLLAAYLLALFSWMLACSMIGHRCAVREHVGGDSAGKPAESGLLSI